MSRSEWIVFTEEMISKMAPEEPGVFELGEPDHIEYIGCAPASINASLYCLKQNIAAVGTDKAHMFRWLTCPEPKTTWQQAMNHYLQHHTDFPMYNQLQRERKVRLGRDPEDPMP